MCFVGDPPEECLLSYFCDASFAGDLEDSKSTSGGIMCLLGPNTFVPLCWMCKKQGAVSHSSAEAEIISVDANLRMEGLPALILWDDVIDVFGCSGRPLPRSLEKTEYLQNEYHVLSKVDWVPPSFPLFEGKPS